MPYYGFMDGQSSGNDWVKTASGWKKLVALRENLHRHIKKIARERFHSSCSNDSSDEVRSEHHHKDGGIVNRDKDWARSQSCDAVEKWSESESQKMHSDYQEIDKPQTSFVLIPRSAGARGMYYTIGEMICKLDLTAAVGDHRRFNYVCRLLELIVTTRFSSLSGLAQKELLTVLEELVNLVSMTHHNMEQVRRILRGAIVAMNNSFASHIGCRATWTRRLEMLKGWLEKLESIQIREREEDGLLKLTDLPDEVLSRILNHLSDHRDIVNVGKTNYLMFMVATENFLWKDLCQYHFTHSQIQTVCQQGPVETDWKLAYSKLHKRHPLHEDYADLLQLCAYCNCLFWRNGGHPCAKELLPEGDTRLIKRPELLINFDINPQQFLDLFQTCGNFSRAR
ncbi:F-box only protein 25-like [Asterias amurensis]|uniref:F-box only protein 25-like n=1 Tax=Asterias amurensis TaxID=7602 RepID=UPI003AB20EB6